METVVEKQRRLDAESEKVKTLKTNLLQCESQKLLLEAKLDEVEEKELKLRDYYQAKIRYTFLSRQVVSSLQLSVSELLTLPCSIVLVVAVKIC
jgi:hypothetical protein